MFGMFPSKNCEIMYYFTYEKLHAPVKDTGLLTLLIDVKYTALQNISLSHKIHYNSVIRLCMIQYTNCD